MVLEENVLVYEEYTIKYLEVIAASSVIKFMTYSEMVQKKSYWNFYIESFSIFFFFLKYVSVPPISLGTSGCLPKGNTGILLILCNPSGETLDIYKHLFLTYLCFPFCIQMMAFHTNCSAPWFQLMRYHYMESCFILLLIWIYYHLFK